VFCAEPLPAGLRQDHRLAALTAELPLGWRTQPDHLHHRG
jgi:hypothetical protein